MSVRKSLVSIHDADIVPTNKHTGKTSVERQQRVDTSVEQLIGIEMVKSSQKRSLRSRGCATSRAQPAHYLYFRAESFRGCRIFHRVACEYVVADVRNYRMRRQAAPCEIITFEIRLIAHAINSVGETNMIRYHRVGSSSIPMSTSSLDYGLWYECPSVIDRLGSNRTS